MNQSVSEVLQELLEMGRRMALRGTPEPDQPDDTDEEPAPGGTDTAPTE